MNTLGLGFCILHPGAPTRNGVQNPSLCHSFMHAVIHSTTTLFNHVSLWSRPPLP